MNPAPTTRLTTTHRVLIGTVIAGAVAIAGAGFAGSYTAVAQLAERKGFGWFASVFPLGIDVGIVVLLALDLLLTWQRMPYPLLRQAAWGLTAATVAFNAATAWPDYLGVGMHATIPILFIITVEAARHAVGRIADITADRHVDGVPLWRWILAPLPTFVLWRRMRLWQIRSYPQAVEMERERVMAARRLRYRYGLRWRSKAPEVEVMALRMAHLGEPVTEALAKERGKATVICSGPTGMLFLQRPKPLPTAAPTKPAGPIGSRVDDVAALLAGQHAPVVYFIRNGDRIKIGTSQNLRNRVRQLCLRIEDIALVLHGDLVLERKLHERFADHRVGDSEWFTVADSLADYLAATTGQSVASASANPSPTGAASGDSGSASSAPTGAAPVDSEPAVSAPVARQRPRSSGAKKAANTRRPMDEWVELTRDLFHSEFARLRRNPTGDEFAAAIKKARLGTVSASTAKNIRAEILDRTDLPALD